MKRESKLDTLYRFKDEDSCLQYLFDAKRTSHCSKCQKPFKYYKVKNRRCYECAHCGNQIYPTAGTIFEGSTTPLYKWFYAIHEFTVSKSGVSATKLQRLLNVTYKTALRMGHKIRSLMKDDHLSLKGIVEVDESQIGGKKKKDKFYVLGMVERKGRIVTKIIGDRPGAVELSPFINRFIAKDSRVYTDLHKGYRYLKDWGYVHRTISHKKYYALRNGVNTQTIEGYWALLKDSILGTHRHVSRKHLQKYLDEFAYRYNRRKEDFSLLEMRL